MKIFRFILLIVITTISVFFFAVAGELLLDYMSGKIITETGIIVNSGNIMFSIFAAVCSCFLGLYGFYSSIKEDLY